MVDTGNATANRPRKTTFLNTNSEPPDTYHTELRRRPPFVKLLIGLVVVLLLGFGLFQGCSRLSPPATPSPEATSTAVTPRPTVEQTAVAASSATASPTPSPTPTVASSDKRWAFVLLGYGGGNHDGANLTDSIMVAIVDPAKKTMTLLSIPRDSWVPMLFDGKNAVYGKVNEAYAQTKDDYLHPERLPRYKGGNGAGNFVKDTLSSLIGIPIDNYMALDFVGFREMIDAVGGIDVEVPDSFSAAYPANDDPSVDASWITVTFTKGKEHMNGERAMQFARAREAIDNLSEGTDFARSRRQRIILEAFKSQLLQPGGLIHLPQILAIASQHLDTDYAIQDVGQIGQLIMSWKDMTIYQTALSNSNYLNDDTGPGGAYVLVPGTPDSSWSQIRAFVRRLWQDPATGVAMAGTRISVVNCTAQPGVAEKVTGTLRQLGYIVGPPTTGTPKAESQLIDQSNGNASLVIDQLETDLGATFPQASEASGSQTGGLVLEIGWNDVRLADLTVPVDQSAPSSAYGIQGSGAWSPATATPEPQHRATEVPATPTQTEATPTVSPTGTPLPEETATETATSEPGATAAPTENPAATATPAPTATSEGQPNTATPAATEAAPPATESATATVQETATSTQ